MLTEFAAAGLFENAYASFRRSPPTSRTSRDEQRLLQRVRPPLVGPYHTH